nr:MAG TPA: hypothetical protein [Caudoviricetes sp.]
MCGNTANTRTLRKTKRRPSERAAFCCRQHHA